MMSPSAVRRPILSALLIAVSLLGVGCSPGQNGKADGLRSTASPGALVSQDDLPGKAGVTASPASPGGKGSDSKPSGQATNSDVFPSNRAEVLLGFPLRPLYESSTFEQRAQPQWFLGGRRYPDSAWAKLVYDPTGARYDSDGVIHKQLWANGGVNVTFWWYPDPVAEEQSGLGVTVRGRPARAFEFRDIPPSREKKPPGVVRSNVTERWIVWQMPFKGGTLRFEVSAHPDKWSTEQMVALINDFTEIK